ncbi:MAG: hypothetical protein ACI84K_001531 [Pseudohongiellaceae bacterium]|jgi:hypothetical protein
MFSCIGFIKVSLVERDETSRLEKAQIIWI